MTGRNDHRVRRFATGLLAAALLSAGSPALAALGGPAASIAKDVAAMKAKVVQKSGPTVTRHDITRPNGGQVHEFTNASGQVFAITWNGPGKPDLRALLGTHFNVLEPKSGTPPGQAMRSHRHPVSVNQPDLKIQMFGHMGWFAGVAYIPSLVPSGFALSALDPAA